MANGNTDRVLAERYEPVEWTQDHPELEGWAVKAELANDARGRLIIRSLTIEPVGNTPESGLTSSTLKAIRVGAVLTQLRSQQRDHADRLLHHLKDLPADHPSRTRLVEIEEKWRRLSGASTWELDDQFLGFVAQLYVDAVEQTGGRGARKLLVDWLREELNDPGLSVETVKGWLRATRAGFLKPAQPGRASAEPDWKLEEWSKRQEEK